MGSIRHATCAVSTRGLSIAEAAEWLAIDGPNELARANRRSALRIAGEVLREPMLALLLTGGVAYLLLRDLAEALILLAFATFSVAVTVIQEARTEHVLEALRDLSAPRALVVRDGERIRGPVREVPKTYANGSTGSTRSSLNRSNVAVPRSEQ